MISALTVAALVSVLVFMNQGRQLIAGGAIAQTKDFRSFEGQVGEIVFLATGGSGDGGE